jgi:hypothetical protein
MFMIDELGNLGAWEDNELYIMLNILHYIRYGEKEFNKNNIQIVQEMANKFNINITKSMFNWAVEESKNFEKLTTYGFFNTRENSTVYLTLKGLWYFYMNKHRTFFHKTFEEKHWGKWWLW